MSLDLCLEGEERDWTHRCSECWLEHTIKQRPTLWQTNITHNLGPMFDDAGVYEILWLGDGLVAGEQLQKLEAGLALMKSEPDRFKKHDAPNGWGRYESAVPWLEEVLSAFKDHPHATLRCSR